jgi:hypothetical protein
MSVKEAVNNISNNVNGWFLPPVQRPYVWGSRYESEKYICKLFDSILMGYPIGGLIVWNNKNVMQYREFLRDYQPGTIPNFVEKGLWSKPDKWLVYDGQQRLQTLYSCLKYTINEKVLTFDLSFDQNSEDKDPDETGFKFYPRNENIPSHVIRMNEIFAMPEGEKTQYRRRLFEKLANSDVNKETVENNIDLLWDVFVKTEKKAIAYFPVTSPDERTVNEIFQRLNTGGVPLSQSDLLLSKIKERKFDFEEDLQLFSKEIYQKTGNGCIFETDQILQLLNLIIRGGIRIAPEKTTNQELDKFVQQWPSMKRALGEFFSNFMWESFRINNRSIIPRQLAIFPLIIFFKVADEKKINFRHLNNATLLHLKKYFILSQLNDWNLQTTIDRFSRKVIESNKDSNELVFPLETFVAYFNEAKQRNTIVYEEVFTGYSWFGLKILMPNRVFLFEPDSRGRFNPEIDHIFPQKLLEQNDEYKSSVDIIWNKQPVKGEVNNYKRRRHPKEFFNSEDGKKYFVEYDFVKSIDNDEWNDWKEFIRNRRLRMIDFLKNSYDIELIQK